MVDSLPGAGPGIAKVIAEAGARVLLATPDSVGLDLQLRALADTAGDVTGIAGPLHTLPEQRSLLATARIETAVVNPSVMTLDPEYSASGPALGPQGAVNLARLMAEGMRDRGVEGNIVFVTGIQQTGPSSAATAFLNEEMEGLAIECAPNAIRVNAVAPGQVASNRKDRAVVSRVAPLGHVSVHPIEVGKAVWFLINDDLSSGTTGTTLKIDRGASLLRPEW